MYQKHDEVAFSKQLNVFEEAMETDLTNRTSEVAKRWEFDFSMEQPAEESGKTMSWEPVTKTPARLSLPAVTLKPRPQKQKMSIASFTPGDKMFKPAAEESNCLFGITSQTDSTAADSMFSGSLVGSFGKGSIVDRGFNGGSIVDMS